MSERLRATDTLSAFSTRAAAAERPDGVAVVVEGRELTWAELSRRVDAAAGELRERAALDRVADEAPPQAPRVAVVGERRLDSLVAVLALIELGEPFALLHPRWTACERQRILDALRPAVVIDERCHAPTAGGDGTHRARPDEDGRDEVVDDERCLAVLFTSGTSGTPKGAVLSRRAFLASARASERLLGWRERDRWLLALPLAHVGGISVVTRVLAARRTVVLDEAPSFSPQAFAATVERSHVTIASLVPTMLHRLLEAGISPPPSLRIVLLGGARASATLLARAAAAGWPVLATYGLTEACSQVATQRPGAGGRGPSEDPGCGPPLAAIEVRIACGAGSSDVDAAGEILIRGAALFSGYLRIEGATPAFERAPLRDDGFFATGDIGALDARGNLHVLGRRTDLIVSGGENVYPAEVEQALERCPGVAAACVVGLADEEWGEIVGAALARATEPLDEAALRSHLAQLAPFKRPRRTLMLDELPLLSNGKVDRRRCRELLEAS